MRIVAGKYKGRKLSAPKGSGTRPTADKVREALFSILGDIEGTDVLDLFAGTGALGLEALSRGAASAVLVERDRKVCQVTRENALAVTGDDGSARLECLDAIRYLQGAPDAAFDLVLLDPPYADMPRLDPRLAAELPRVLRPGARVVAESDRRAPLELPESELALALERRYGDTLLRIFDAP